MGRRPDELYSPRMAHHMHSATFLLGTAILLAAFPSAAQERGTIDFGAFVSYNGFASTYDMRSAAGLHVLGGGRIALGESTALRLDYTRYFNGAAQHGSLKTGVSLRKP